MSLKKRNLCDGERRHAADLARYEKKLRSKTAAMKLSNPNEEAEKR
jgi:hypothetical protein